MQKYKNKKIQTYKHTKNQKYLNLYTKIQNTQIQKYKHTKIQKKNIYIYTCVGTAMENQRRGAHTYLLLYIYICTYTYIYI